MATANPIVSASLIEIDYLNALDQLMGRDITNGAPGWAPSPNPAVYVSANSFKEVGVDTRTRYSIGTKWSCTDAAVTKFFYVAAAPTYAASDTTVTISGAVGETLSGGAITNPRYSYVQSPHDFPNGGPWIVPSMLNSWVNYGGGYSTTGYFKDTMGIVHIQGTVKSGTSTDATIFTLPAGYCPASYGQFATPAGAGAAVAIIRILTNGVVAPIAGGSTTITSLDGITFRAA